MNTTRGKPWETGERDVKKKKSNIFIGEYRQLSSPSVKRNTNTVTFTAHAIRGVRGPGFQGVRGALVFLHSLYVFLTRNILCSEQVAFTRINNSVVVSRSPTF